MGYTTNFTGEFSFDRPLDADTLKLLKGLNATRRMKRNVEGFGVEGEFYIAGGGFAGQNREPNITDYNNPPSPQPGLWCKWEPSEDGTTLAWDGGEKFYDYVEWLQYLIDKIIDPRGYKLNGAVEWQGEDQDDMGRIVIKDNRVKTLVGKIVYCDPDET